MRETEALIKTADGTLDTFICHPDEGGPHPVVILYMDAPGIRQELRDMASRLACVGYYVMLPNLYYRYGREGGYGYDLALIRKDETHLNRMHELRLSLTNAGIVADTKALLEHLDTDPAAADGPIGCVGYCMSGQFVLSVAAAYPERIAAVASFYGVGIVSDQPDSPHRDAARIRADTYLAFASDDPWVPATVLEQLPGIIERNGWRARLEVYPGTTHGFAFPSRADYKREAGERHWERLFTLFDRNLRHTT
ncbi:MAG: dienelactone hydrolase family protein [Burkholderiaceae bacterium]